MERILDSSFSFVSCTSSSSPSSSSLFLLSFVASLLYLLELLEILSLNDDVMDVILLCSSSSSSRCRDVEFSSSLFFSWLFFFPLFPGAGREPKSLIQLKPCTRPVCVYISLLLLLLLLLLWTSFTNTSFPVIFSPLFVSLLLRDFNCIHLTMMTETNVWGTWITATDTRQRNKEWFPRLR